MTKPIVPAVARELLIAELNQDRFVRFTRKGGNEIYIINHHNSPNTLTEIGRLRELTFRDAGGGTGEEIDIDEFDIIESCYEQLIVWSPEDQEIIGGYRFIKCKEAISADGEHLALSTAHYFDFETDFINNYLPVTIELGRSWVQPAFQPSVNPRKGLFALDNIWDGLGAITVMNPEIAYFFGKFTMYPNYDTECRDFLLYFLHYFFPDKEHLMTPKYPIQMQYGEAEFQHLLQGLEFKDAFRVLNQYVRTRGENVPPLVNIYMHLSPTMKTFGTSVNPDFGGVEETGILITLKDIYEDKKARHLDSMERPG
ncbi:MAG: GNAT family N-acetyltransferase [Saprospiraceae bacterium]|nr:GNAT family N-acetyltransferase [Saprospiraceae bacterium]